MITHEVVNQAPPLEDYNTADYAPLRDGLTALGAAAALDEVDEVGRVAGSAHALHLGDLAERNQPILRTHDRFGHRVDEVGRVAGSAHALHLEDLAERHQPILRTHDRFGHRIDEVEYDPAYHELMRLATGFGLHATPWAQSRAHAHLIRAAKFISWYSVDAGHGCPISMTYAAVAALRVDPAQAALYEPLLSVPDYDFGLRVPSTKRALVAGMSMTEKQGGSDVRANTTTATRQPDGTYRIVGHKWFTSAPMSDLLLTLAVAPGGLTCFVLPRVLPDGTRNPIRLQRLKEKLGNHSNASSEVEYENAIGWRLGDEGRGVRTIIEMVNGTRLDCTLGTVALMRQGVQLAAHHVAHRAAFGRTLIDQPLMRNVIADLAVEAEASTLVALWLADLTDAALGGDPRATALRRVGVAVTKYYVCKRAPSHAAEALECLGGNGYVEDSRLPRLFRESPLASIWEGSGNVAALDVLRAAARSPEALEILFDELARSGGADARFDQFLARVKDRATRLTEFEARTIVGDLALAIQAALLLRYGHPAVTDAFIASRLDGQWGTVLGTLPATIDTGAIIERAVPKL